MRSRRAASRPAPERSNLPFVLGGVGGLVILVVVVLIFVMGGEGKKETTPSERGPEVASGGGGGTPSAGTGTASRTDKRKRLMQELLHAGRQENLAAVEKVFREAKELGIASIQTQAARFALEKDPELEWANMAVGNKSLKELFANVPMEGDAVTYATDELDNLIEAAEYGSKWATPDRYSELTGWWKKAEVHIQRMKTDRDYKDTKVVEAFVEVHPVYMKYDRKSFALGPYILFAQYPKGQTFQAAEKAKKIVERNAALLQHLYKKFHELFGERLDLPDTREFERLDMRRLKIFVFFTREAMDDYQTTIGMRLPAGAAAYYRRDDQWITLFEVPGAATRGGEGSFKLGVVLHESTHQLVHLYRKAVVERNNGGEEVLWMDPKLAGGPHWFREGIAEFFSGVKDLGDGRWEFFIPLRHRLREWWMTRKSKRSEWSFKETLSIKTGPDLVQRARTKGLADQVRLSSLFYAQAWSWIHFLYFYKDGKYREKFMAYADKEFRGEGGTQAWNDVWGAGKDYDWGPVEKEWLGYVEGLFKKMGFK